MEEWQINQDLLQYDDDTHTYYVNGMRVPSITQIIKIKFPKKYDGIDEVVLKRAAERGTAVHKMIEDYEKYGTENDSDQLQHYKQLKELYKFEAIENEIPIIYDYKGFKVAGRLDIVLQEFGVDDLGLADIKTTCNLDYEYLLFQLNLYRLGYQQSYHKEISFLRAIHLRKDIKKYVKIPINEECIFNFLEDIVNLPF